jgi:mono/diheme cytochrome c family protein
MRHGSLISGAFALVVAGGAWLPLGGSLYGQGGGKQAPGRASAGGAAGRAKAGNLVPLDNWQPKKLPALPAGVTLDQIRQGDSVYHGKGGCNTCHGSDAMGMPNSGSALSLGLNFIPPTPRAIDSLVTAGIPEALTRSGVAMPGRGLGQNLTPEEIRQVAAYVWAISQVQGEPWPGGHRAHGQDTVAAGARSKANP